MDESACLHLPEVGASHTLSWTVEAKHLARELGSGLADVLATPALVAFCEETARTLIDPALPDGQTTVGTMIELTHTAPTPPGMQVRVTARLASVDGRRLRFDLEASDEVEPIGTGAHVRYVVEESAFGERAARKWRRTRNP
jgi:fluoroacetyl-CoA thioesterase